MDARRLGTDDERLGDLTVRVAAGDEGEDLGLAGRETEVLLGAPLSTGCRLGRGGEIEPGALGEQFELAEQR